MIMGFSLLLRVIIAHLLADFFLQPYTWVSDKRLHHIKSRQLYYHIAIVGMLTFFLMLYWSAWELPLFITVTHFVIDWWKSTRKDTMGVFVADQAAHMLMIVTGWLIFSENLPNSSDFIFVTFRESGFWIVLTGYLLVLRPIGFLIEKATSQWRNELTSEKDEVSGLTNAGTWIGYLERVIILTFILLQEYSAIGFLIPAKSVFRFSGGLKDNHERKHAEYILIGTLISFSLAILTGIGALSLLADG